MKNFEFCRPTTYYFGCNLENETGRIIEEKGFHRVLVVYGGEFTVTSGLLERVLDSLRRHHIYYICQGGVVPNPRADHVYKLIELGHEHKVDFVLGIGGGSVIDSAKAAALGIANDGDFFDFFLRKRVPTAAVPTGVVLTIPSAGSEGSSTAVIQKRINGEYSKRGFSSPFNVPLFAIMNPDLSKTLSAWQTSCGIVDMMAHILERYFTNTPDVSVTDRLCEGLLCSIIETVPQLIRDPDNTEARANLMWASTLAHNDICGVGREQDWASHALEHQLSALYDVSHGAGLAVILPAWMEYTVSHNPLRFAQFASRVFGIPLDFTDPSITALAGIKALRDFFRNLGMPLNFEEIGAKEKDIPLLLHMLGANEGTIGHFVVLQPDDCEAIYRIAAHYQYK